eukprot:gene18084-biopygen18945
MGIARFGKGRNGKHTYAWHGFCVKYPKVAGGTRGRLAAAMDPQRDKRQHMRIGRGLEAIELKGTDANRTRTGRRTPKVRNDAGSETLGRPF